MTRSGSAAILHADLDAFYASVEQLIDPSLRGQSIAVGGGVVLAASYEARARGVRSGMAGWRARQLCPGLVFVAGHFDEYQRLGDEFVSLLYDFTPLVERVSIDEAFMDVGGSTHLFGAPGDIACAIRRRVRQELGLPVSVGVARTKHLAKVASQVAKPDGLIVVEPEGEPEFLAPLPVDLLWGVGPVTRAQLGELGVRTVGELARVSSSQLERAVGRAVGRKLASLALNVDPRAIETETKASSVGAQAALGRRRATDELLRSSLGYLADRVAGRLRASRRAGRTVTVRVRFTGLRSVTRSMTLPFAISSTVTLRELALGLVSEALTQNTTEPEITLLGLSVANLLPEPALQLELPLGSGDRRHRPGSALGAARWSVDRSMDGIRARFGRDKIGYARVVFSSPAHVPEAFRRLAERGAPQRVSDG